LRAPQRQPKDKEGGVDVDAARILVGSLKSRPPTPTVSAARAGAGIANDSWAATAGLRMLRTSARGFMDHAS